jgi:hypothetical protein
LIAVGTKARARGLRERALVVRLAPMLAAARAAHSRPVVNGVRSVLRAGIALSGASVLHSVVVLSVVIALSASATVIVRVLSVVLMAHAVAVATVPASSVPVPTAGAAIVPAPIDLAATVPVLSAPVLIAHPVIVLAVRALALTARVAAAAAVSVVRVDLRVRAASRLLAPPSRNAALSAGLCAVIAIKGRPAGR